MVEVRLSEEGDRWRWCKFNASISTREGTRRDEALSEDEAETASSCWLHGMESRHGLAVSRRPEEMRCRAMLQNFKISFYVNLHIDKIFEKRKRVG
jgi:hypothetical protein